MQSFRDPVRMPVTNETMEQRIVKLQDLAGTPGQSYVEKRGIPLSIAQQTEVGYDASWNGRAAVVAPMKDDKGNLRILHGRYLQQLGKQNKMFSFGEGNGMIWVQANTRTILLVEGLFDALSLSVCGYSSMATVGRWANWLPEYCVGKKVFLAFDAARSGGQTADYYRQQLIGATTQRLLPPDRCKDWNTALVKRGKEIVTRCLQNAIKE